MRRSSLCALSVSAPAHRYRLTQLLAPITRWLLCFCRQEGASDLLLLFVTPLLRRHFCQSCFLLGIKSTWSGLNSSIRIKARSKMGTCGSDWNICVCRGFTQGPWAPDSHSLLYLISFEVCVFAASCPLLYKHQRHHWTSKTTSFSLPACSPQRGAEEGDAFFTIFDLSSISRKTYSKKEK